MLRYAHWLSKVLTLSLGNLKTFQIFLLQALLSDDSYHVWDPLEVRSYKYTQTNSFESFLQTIYIFELKIV